MKVKHNKCTVVKPKIERSILGTGITAKFVGVLRPEKVKKKKKIGKENYST